jgi:hypothetical protein
MNSNNLIVRLGRLWCGLRCPALAASVVLMTLAALAACTVTTVLPCPASLILRNAAQVTRFYPGRSETPENVRYVATVDEAKLNCSYDSESYQRIDVALGVKFDAQRPPGRPADVADLRYFVAIVNLEGQVLAKKDFPIRLDFPAGATVATKVDQVLQTIPVKYPQNGGSIQVWVGYQISDAELQYNRTHPAP